MTFLILNPASGVQAELPECHYFVLASKNLCIIGFITSYFLITIELLKKVLLIICYEM